MKVSLLVCVFLFFHGSLLQYKTQIRLCKIPAGQSHLKTFSIGAFEIPPRTAGHRHQTLP